jgi:hypothetical protein
MKSIVVRDHIEGIDRSCNVVGEADLPNYGTLYFVDCPHINPRLAVIMSNDGRQFTVHDWQGVQPEDTDDIPRYRWYDQNGTESVIMDGLPRVLA